MTPEEYEVAYCKGRRQEMEDFIEWLDDHAMVVQSAIDDGVSHQRVLERTLEFMGKLKARMEEKLKNGPKIISRTNG
ncbi:MAG: hypothetical protein J6V16_01740 [Bacteroidales bacterium]|nr:hypothetical protein [Bacteroidales bacterium]